MKVKILEHKSQLLEVKEDWNRLFNDGDYSDFQSFDYCYHSALVSNLFTICLLENNRIIEIWPCEVIDKKLRFINDIHADFCDILSSSNSMKILDVLKNNNLLGNLSFRNLKKDALILKKLVGLDFCDLSNSVNYSILSLEQTDVFPANFSHFVYRQKRRLKRIINKYNSVHTIIAIENNSFPYEDIITLKNKMIALNMRDDTFLDDGFLRLAEGLYNSGKLIVSKVVVGNEIVAISLLFKSENYFSFWVDLYNDFQMINLYHNVMVIKNITEKSNAFFNFGRGTYNYKIQNFSPEIFNLFEFNSFDSESGRLVFLLQKKIIKWFKKIHKKIKS